MVYHPQGVCSKAINLEVENGVIKSVEFTGGCNGNLQGISRLVSGMKIEDAIERLRGIKCGYKNTSCPDQLACALQEILDN
ncbi:MAG: TIGR03905 family TSCPD domain-containing protein [Lachnospiraceae bacterium]|nr:TIGR03905 family TSCPD domain-containing protein [Lachnospiraceae bacterium]